MANIKKQYIAAFVAGLALTASLTACSTPAASAPDPQASAATADEKPAETPPAVNELVKPFGEVVTYKDGVSISVSAPTQFTPSNLDSFPLPEGQTPLVFKVVLTNNSDKPLEPGAIAQANSGGKPATYIADVANTEYPDLGMFPTTTILPGQTLEWFTAFSVIDPADITLEIAPAPIDYDNAIFTNVPF